LITIPPTYTDKKMNEGGGGGGDKGKDTDTHTHSNGAMKNRINIQ